MLDLSKFALKEKVAVITGGGSGIGQAIACDFAKAGAKVAITSRKIKDLEATALEISAAGGEAFVVPAHLGKHEEIQKVVDAILPGSISTKMIDSRRWHLPLEEAKKEKDKIAYSLAMGRIGDLHGLGYFQLYHGF